MRIAICTPAPRGARTGNRVTAERWALTLRGLGHRVVVCTGLVPHCELLIALHAVRSAVEIRSSATRTPRPAIVVVLTGTDYQPRLSRRAEQTLQRADRIVVLNAPARDALPSLLRKRTLVIVQSARPAPPWIPRGHRGDFRVVVAGHLRPVKDPWRAARAVRGLPADSKLHVLHAGGALEPAMAEVARAEMRRNPRYSWLGELDALRTRRLIAGASAFVLSSRAEGGASALSEAIASGVPIISTAIANALDLLGPRHPGLFTVGATSELRELLQRAEREPAFLERLRPTPAQRARVSPEHERDALRVLTKRLG